MNRKQRSMFERGYTIKWGWKWGWKWKIDHTHTT